MKITLLAAALLLASPNPASTQPVSFNADATGAPPAGWTLTHTGTGTSRWTIATDAGAPSGGKILRQSGTATYPLAIKTGTAIQNGFVEVAFKAVGGTEDRAAGLIWRLRDANNYYVVRANALENNVALYYTEGGSRRTLKYVDAPVAANAWHVLRVEFKRTTIHVLLDGKAVIEFEDARITGAGAVGVWTKADSVTAFDDFSFGADTKH